MSKSILIISFCLFLSSKLLFAVDLCDTPELIQTITTVTFKQHKECLKSLAWAPTTPPFYKNFFEDVNGQEMILYSCNQKEGEADEKFLFLSDDGALSLKLPIYRYGNAGEQSLPRNVIHFTHEGKDLYIAMEFMDPRVIKKDQIPAFAADNMVSMAKVQSEFINKYETWLKRDGKLGALGLKSPSTEELNSLLGCMDKNRMKFLEEYVFNRVLRKKIIPMYGTIVSDSQRYDALSSEEREKYRLLWDEMEREILADVLKSFPVCEGIFTKDEIQAVFNNRFEKSKAPYGTLRRYYFGD